ncbi:putative mediator of RNA polymerase II transcription subunit 31 [Tritrichomonas foetus]|uniref:Mediator of RNA polymerase II transcription subunit 31 n=1 Tax=Tritrichomonas foetus TaxID=1144522 RepID=A0A1J4L3I8_9EUKA|nr:putative mediator of RNA polymerase II transcription subunit 31 [Tritrichomonas foetus]|eukprot:OHT16540.1 putative mediator of RNA polymerase II transcription subunit 31 [Tritrichomonas foetus]
MSSSDSELSDGDSEELISGSDSDLVSDSESSNKEDEEKKEEPKQEIEEPRDLRFEKELEFVLCLANPRYVFSLASKNYFGDPNFINYLKYLLYWCQPEYAKFVRYPQALQFLRLLQDPDFRKYVSNFENIITIEQTQFKYWEVYQRNRLDLTLPTPDLKKPESFPE